MGRTKLTEDELIESWMEKYNLSEENAVKAVEIYKSTGKRPVFSKIIKTNNTTEIHNYYQNIIDSLTEFNSTNDNNLISESIVYYNDLIKLY